MEIKKLDNLEPEEKELEKQTLEELEDNALEDVSGGLLKPIIL